MELRHLRYFRAVAEELHFGRAAQRLHIAQPPLSAQIRQLEAELGLQLLVRSTRRVELTPAGAAYLEKVVGILDAVDAAGAQAQRIADGRQGSLAIGCVGSATYSLLPRLVRALREEVPDLDVSVRGEMLAPAQIQALRNGEIDMALLRPPVSDPDVELETIRSDRLFVALWEDDPRAEQDSITIEDLHDAEFITHAGHGRSVMGSVLASVSARAGFVPRVRHEVEETSTMVTLVAAGLGVALVPEPTAELGIAGVRYRPLVARDPTIVIPLVDLAVGWLGTEPTPITERVLEVLRGLG